MGPAGFSVLRGLLGRLLQAGVAQSAQMFCAACYFLCWRLWVRLLLLKCLCEIISESYICIIYNLSDNQNIQRSANDYTKFSNTLLQYNIITRRSAIHYFDRVLHAPCDVRTSSLLLFEIIREMWTMLYETKLKIVRSSPSEMQCPANLAGNRHFLSSREHRFQEVA